MSLKSWCKEFYPILAEQTKIEDAVAHSLRKWIGLRSENLAKHGCRVTKRGSTGIPYVEEPSDECVDWRTDKAVCITSDTCALCHHYLLEEDDHISNVCERCPLYKHLGKPCDGGKFNGERRPYEYWYETLNPEPMISALQSTLEKQCSNA